MWVVKRPKRYDFCGCPPCHLCFDWAEPQKPKVVQEADPIVVEELPVIPGIQKMTEDITGKPWAEVTGAEIAQVEQIGQKLHEQHLIKSLEGGPKEPEGGATFNQKEEDKWFETNINLAGAARRAEKAYQEKLNRPKSLDQMDWGASEEAKKLEADKAEESKKELEKAAKKEQEKEISRPSKNEQKRREQEAYERMRARYSDPFR